MIHLHHHSIWRFIRYAVKEVFDKVMVMRNCPLFPFAGFNLTSSKFKQTKLSILLRFYFHEVSEKPKTNTYTDLHFEVAFRFVIRLKRGITFTYAREVFMETPWWCPLQPWWRPENSRSVFCVGLKSDLFWVILLSEWPLSLKKHYFNVMSPSREEFAFS